MLQGSFLWKQQRGLSVRAAGSDKHQPAAEKSRRPALHHPVPGSVRAEGLSMLLFALRPSNMLVYLGDGSAQFNVLPY